MPTATTTTEDSCLKLAQNHPHDFTMSQIFNILIEQTNAARRNKLVDGRRLIRAVDAVERITKVERSCAERIARTACHEPRQIGLAVNHFWRRMPVRPFDHASNALRAGPCETLTADANTVPQGPAETKNQVKVCVGRGTGRFGRLIIYELTLQLWGEPLCIRFRLIFRGGASHSRGGSRPVRVFARQGLPRM